MIYYYDIAIKYTVGDKDFIKIYKKCFTEICDFFIWLKDKHKDNFKIISIKEHKMYGSAKVSKIFFEEFIEQNEAENE